MKTNETTPLYMLDRDKLREVSEYLRVMWDMVPGNFYVIPDGATIKLQSSTDVVSDKEPA